MTVAVLGLGRMGLPLARRLAKAAPVVGFDLDPTRTAEANAAGLGVASSAEEAIESAEVVVTCLTGATAERGALLGAASTSGALTVMRPGQLLVQCTSGDPLLCDAIDDAVRGSGIGFVAAPMFGGPLDMAEGRAGFFIGGASDDVARLLPLLHHVTDPDRLELVGPQPRHAQATKLLVNALWFGQVALATEVLLVGAQLGLEPGALLDALSRSAATGSVVRSVMPALLDDDYIESFGLREVVEELETVRSLTAVSARHTEVMDAVADVHARALDTLGPVLGELRVADYLQRLTGTTLAGRP